MSTTTIKCVAVGDGFVGKTSLLMRLCKKQWDKNYVPTIFDNHLVTDVHNGQVYEIVFIDTAGQEDYSLLRTQFYESADVFLICFDVSSTDTFSNVKEKWLAELEQFSKASRVLVGTKSDLRNDPETIDKLNANNKIFVTKTVAKNFAVSHAMKYIECSSVNQEHIQEVLKTIIEAYINKTQNIFSSSNQCSCVNPIFQLLKRTFCCKNNF